MAWKFICEFYDTDRSKPTGLAPKLTRRHIHLPPFSTLSVKPATQVLSHSVATGMKVMAQWGLIHKDATDTADFLLNFDELFNAFNSSTLTSTARMKDTFSDTSGHIPFSTEKLAWLKRLHSNGPGKLPCVRGWQMAINCLLQLWDKGDVHVHKVYLFSIVQTVRKSG